MKAWVSIIVALPILGCGSSRIASRAAPQIPPTMRVRTGQPRPRWISLPKADEERPSAYVAPGGAAIEAVGVCRFDERAIACWNPSGRPFPLLQRRIASLLTHRKEPFDQGVRLRFGRKNRIVVLRQTLEPVEKDAVPDYRVSIVRIGDEMPNSRVVPRSGGERKDIREIAYFVQEPPDVTRVHLRLAVRKSIPASGRIGMEQGASCVFEGCRFTLESVEKTRGGGLVEFGSAHPTEYRLRYRVTGKPAPDAEFWIGSLERRYCDMSGAIVSRKAYETARETPSWAGGAGVIGAYAYGQYKPDERAVDVLCNFDPLEIDALDVMGYRSRTVDLVDIPLDPRRNAQSSVVR